MKNKLAKTISYLLPNRVVYWALIRAYAYTTVHSHPDKSPDEIGFGMVTKSWEVKTAYKINDKGEFNNYQKKQQKV